jgi:hypothetical protein
MGGGCVFGKLRVRVNACKALTELIGRTAVS